MSVLLRRNDRSTNVALWQGFLVSQGYRDVKPDGHFGPITEKATKGFQRTSGLREDGIVGANTIGAATAKGFVGFAGRASEQPTPSSGAGKLILVSAGHTNKAGQDRGVAGNGFIEGKLAVVLRDAVASKLRQTAPQHSVIKDGADGVNEPLSKALILARKSDVAVEIHWNAGPSTATGIEVLSKPNKKALAQALAKAIADTTGLKLRGDAGWKSDSSGQHSRLAFCEAGGLIIEVCFISNSSDMTAYQQNFSAVVRNLAQVLANA